MTRRPASTSRAWPAAALAAAVLAAAPAAQAQRIVDYAQLDASSETITVVAVRALGDPRSAAPAPLLTATFARWTDGQAGGVGAIHRFGLPTGEHAVSIGVGAGINGWRSRVPGDTDSEQGLSARLQAESYGPAPGGHYYVLLQGSSFRDSWLATAQYDPAALPLAVELSRYGETGYHATTVTLRIALGRSGWSARVGGIDDDSGRHAVVGIGYNGF